MMKGKLRISNKQKADVRSSYTAIDIKGFSDIYVISAQFGDEKWGASTLVDKNFNKIKFAELLILLANQIRISKPQEV